MSTTSMSDKFFILSCDGGGIRGLASAVILEELEKRLKARQPGRLLHNYLDLVSGTSTGSIVACGISSGIPTDKIKELYLNKGIDIFPELLTVVPKFIRRKLRRIMLEWQNSSQPIYQENYSKKRGINSVLKEVLGADNKFGALNVQTLVTSYDTLNQHFVAFNSTHPECADINTWEVARASSAAPVAFPAYLLRNEKFIQFWKKDNKETFCDDKGEECIPLVDGGLAANNPAMCAIAERVREGTEISKIVMISVGTGHNPQHASKKGKLSSKQLNYNDARNWGAGEWINPMRDIPILRALFDGSADVADFQVKQVLGDSNYFRFQPEFSEEYQTFNANKDKLDQMVKDTEKYLARTEIKEKMDCLVSLLLNEEEEETEGATRYALTPSM